MVEGNTQTAEKHFRDKNMDEVAIHDEIKLKIQGNKQSRTPNRDFMRVKSGLRKFIC
jgi:hypothetical protein